MNDTDERLTLHGTISLGGLIRLLEKRPKDEEVRYDFGWFAPEGLDSYRGYYDHLALGYAEECDDIKDITVADLLALLHQADGKTFEGYKGGTFRMALDTPVWVARWGECPGTGITGIYDREGTTYLRTELVD